MSGHLQKNSKLYMNSVEKTKSGRFKNGRFVKPVFSSVVFPIPLLWCTPILFHENLQVCTLTKAEFNRAFGLEERVTWFLLANS